MTPRRCGLDRHLVALAAPRLLVESTIRAPMLQARVRLPAHEVLTSGCAAVFGFDATELQVRETVGEVTLKVITAPAHCTE